VNRADTPTRRVTTAIVVSVGLFAGGDSYSHIFHLARLHGQDVVSAALVPLAGDGLVVAASATMLAAARINAPVPARARLMMLGGIGDGRRERGLRAATGPHRSLPVGVGSPDLRRVHGTADVDAGEPRDAVQASECTDSDRIPG
jgi:hypothetical protein